jgi:membrane protein
MLKQTLEEFLEDNCMSMAAALAYYTVFSLPPLLLIIVTLAGLFVDPNQAQQAIQQQVGGLVGASGAQQVQTMIESVSQRVQQGGGLTLVLAIGGLLFGATGAFAQLQLTLNRAWQIAPDPESGGIMNFFGKRLLSLGMILGIAFLLLVSLILSAAIASLSGYVGQWLPAGFGAPLLFVVDASVSLFVITLLFAAIFKVLPDARIAWKDVWVGAFGTALLFMVGKLLISLYLGQSNPGAVYGAAGSLALILVWIYYSALIVFLGAEFTQVWARTKGTAIMPDEGAVRVVEKKRTVSSSNEPNQSDPRSGAEEHGTE